MRISHFDMRIFLFSMRISQHDMRIFFVLILRLYQFFCIDVEIFEKFYDIFSDFF